MQEMKETGAAVPATPAEPKEKVAVPAELPLERDRRGVVLPGRQRVGGIITPQ